MKRPAEFYKYHGLGNSFILIDCMDNAGYLPSKTEIIDICSVNFGVGADGILLVLPSAKADARMRIFNADGSEAEMCGNGIRCFVAYLHDYIMPDKDVLVIESMVNLHETKVSLNQEGKVESVSVMMGAPDFSPGTAMLSPSFDGEISVDDCTFSNVHPVSMGNPHLVIFVDDAPDEKLLTHYGSVIEKSKYFPAGTNVEFVSKLESGELNTVVWERGAGITPACGTGACAVASAAVKTGIKTYSSEIHVKLPGGILDITVLPDMSDIIMRGNVKEVFKAEWS